MLASHAQDVAGKRVGQFRYRGLRPSLVGNTLTVDASPDDHGLILWIALPDGAVSMRAEATF